MDAFNNFLTINKLKKGEIASFLGVSRAFITQICSGQRKLPDDKLALSCFCRALLCGGTEEFKVNIHKNLGILLERNNELAHAKTEYLQNLS